jgi:hypothetical protein
MGVRIVGMFGTNLTQFSEIVSERGKNDHFRLSWGARGRWFESSRPDHYFSNQNAQIGNKSRGAKAYCELPFYTDFYRDLPASLTQIWHKFLRASETVSELARTAMPHQVLNSSARRQYVYRTVGGAA